MLGVDLEQGLDAGEVRDRALDLGLVVNAPSPGTIRMLPPLVIGVAEVDEALGVFGRALE
jgi:acetylornithine aminotransferase